MTPTQLSLDDLVQLFWGSQLGDHHRLCNGDLPSALDKGAYLDYFQLQCGYFFQAGIDTHQRFDIIREIVCQIKADTAREKIVSTLDDDGEPRQHAINLAARLLVMCSLGRLRSEATPRVPMDWNGGSLRFFLDQHFNEPSELGERVRLPKKFDAWAIEKVGGIKIQFTDNLVDHFRLANDDTTLLVFHHVSFLEMQTSESLLPQSLIEETLRTLALLFPQSDESECSVDKRLGRCGTLQTSGRQIEKFHHWRDRIVVLKQAYDDASPDTLTQWWFDRRNGPQWYTFWVAILVLAITSALGVLQCVEGALQVYKAYNPSN